VLSSYRSIHFWNFYLILGAQKVNPRLFIIWVSLIWRDIYIRARPVQSYHSKPSCKCITAVYGQPLHNIMVTSPGNSQIKDALASVSGMLRICWESKEKRLQVWRLEKRWWAQLLIVHMAYKYKYKYTVLMQWRRRQVRRHAFELKPRAPSWLTRTSIFILLKLTLNASRLQQQITAFDQRKRLFAKWSV